MEFYDKNLISLYITITSLISPPCKTYTLTQLLSLVKISSSKWYCEGLETNFKI